jgi:predicted TIM-barrel fold metal-dependent hydrolase
MGSTKGLDMTHTYQAISADCHLEIPPDDFVGYVPEEYRDRAPRRIQTGDGGDSWLVEGVPLVHTGPNLTAGGKVQTRGKSYWKSDGSRATGAGGAVQRLREQDLDGIDAEVLFPPIFVKDALAGIADGAAYEAIVHAYNVFVANDIQAVAPDRFVALGVIPNRGIDSAVAELKRCSQLGLPGICLTSFPSGGATAKPEDDRFWEEALSLQMPVTAHTHFGAPYPPFVTGPQAGANPNAATLTTRQAFQRPLWTIAQLIVTGVFDRFPGLKIYFAETNASWLPNALYELDENYQTYEHAFATKLSKLPSEYVRDHVWFSFIKDVPVASMIDLLPVENLMWGSDFPHSVGSFPNSRSWLAETFSGVSPDVVRKFLVETPAAFFHLDPTAPVTETDDVVRRIAEHAGV